MKCAILQQATRITNGTQDWTDAGISSDFAGALFWGSDSTTNGSTSANGKFFFGATDGVRNVAFDAESIDATAAASANSTTIGSNTACLMRVSSTGTQTVLAAVNSVLSNGVRLSYGTTDGGAYLVNGLLLSGSDIAVEVSSVFFSGTDTSKVVTHNDSAAPQTVIALCSFGSSTTGSDSATFPKRPIIGLWDGTNMVGLGTECTTSTNPVALAGRLVSGDMGHMMLSGTDAGSVSISSVGATTFTFSRTTTGFGTPMFCVFVSIRAKSGTFAAQAGALTLPTSTGNAGVGTTMAAPAQVLLTFPTRLTTTALVSNSDTAGSLSLGGACNNAGTTQQGATASTDKNAVATTVSKSYTSNSLALLSLDNTGATVNQATITSWNPDGTISINHTQVGASPFEAMYLKFGIGAAGAPFTPYSPPTQFYTNDVYLPG